MVLAPNPRARAISVVDWPALYIDWACSTSAGLGLRLRAVTPCCLSSLLTELWARSKRSPTSRVVAPAS